MRLTELYAYGAQKDTFKSLFNHSILCWVILGKKEKRENDTSPKCVESITNILVRRVLPIQMQPLIELKLTGHQYWPLTLLTWSHFQEQSYQSILFGSLKSHPLHVLPSFARYLKKKVLNFSEIKMLCRWKKNIEDWTSVTINRFSSIYWSNGNAS